MTPGTGTPAATVIVPLYDKERYVARALRSVLGQTLSEIEIIVVDDGSTDGGPEVVRAFRDPRLRLVTQPNAGPGAARNRGIALAAAPIVAFLDADDEWSPEYLAHAVAALERAPRALAAVCGFVDEARARRSAADWQRRGVREGLFEARPQTPVAELVAVVEYMTTITTAARTSAVRELGGFYARGCRYGEDAALMIKLALSGPLVVSLRQLAVYHREESDLNRRDRGMRPVEPFLIAPDEFETATPSELRPLLRDFLAARAFKTACVLTYWGRWRDGRSLLRRFRPQRKRRIPLAVAARLGVNPLGAGAGYLLRTSRRVAQALP